MNLKDDDLRREIFARNEIDRLINVLQQAKMSTSPDLLKNIYGEISDYEVNVDNMRESYVRDIAHYIGNIEEAIRNNIFTPRDVLTELGMNLTDDEFAARSNDPKTIRDVYEKFHKGEFLDTSDYSRETRSVMETIAENPYTPNDVLCELCRHHRQNEAVMRVVNLAAQTLLSRSETTKNEKEAIRSAIRSIYSAYQSEHIRAEWH